MIYLYLIITVTAAIFLVADLVLLYMEKIKNFGMERNLFKFKGETIPAENFLPENLTMSFVLFLSLGVAGFFLSLLNIEWYLSLPISISAGMLVCFIIQQPLRNAVNKKKGIVLPEKTLAAGIEGFAAEKIEADGYGKIEFEYKNVRFKAPAVSAYETMIPKFERVIIIYEEDGVYFVESIREVYEVLDEE